jgi:hypothetical protein
VNDFALKSGLVLWGILAVASSNIANLYGNGDTWESLSHRTQAIRSLNRQLSMLSDDTAYDSAVIATSFLHFIHATTKARVSALPSPPDFNQRLYAKN